jgi:hypothetical protein
VKYVCLIDFLKKKIKMGYINNGIGNSSVQGVLEGLKFWQVRLKMFYVMFQHRSEIADVVRDV